jgi:D-alanine-D-alanine ligase
VKKLALAVLAGGWSSEREISLVTGRGVLEGFRRLGWKAKGFDLRPDPGTARGAVPRKAASWAEPIAVSKLLSGLRAWGTQAVFPCLHGPGGEDGCLQGLLELAAIPYAGSGVQASSLAMDKVLSKKLMAQSGIPTPAWEVVARGRKGRLPLPCVVKPPSQGSSVGVTLVKKPGQMAAALKLAWHHEPTALVEALVEGREFTVGILDDQALPVVEIVAQHEFYDWHSKYAQGGSKHLCPAPLPKAKASELQALALKFHRTLGCKGWSRVDFMMDRRGKAWMLELNTLPGMTPTSLLPDAARAAGLGYDRLLVRMLDASLTRRS